MDVVCISTKVKVHLLYFKKHLHLVISMRKSKIFPMISSLMMMKMKMVRVEIVEVRVIKSGLHTEASLDPVQEWFSMISACMRRKILVLYKDNLLHLT